MGGGRLGARPPFFCCFLGIVTNPTDLEEGAENSACPPVCLCNCVVAFMYLFLFIYLFIMYLVITQVKRKAES